MPTGRVGDDVRYRVWMRSIQMLMVVVRLTLRRIERVPMEVAGWDCEMGHGVGSWEGGREAGCGGPRSVSCRKKEKR